MKALSNIDDLLKNGLFEDALTAMNGLCNENKLIEQNNEVVLLLSRLRSIKKQIQIGLMDHENTEINNIRYSAIRLFHEDLRLKFNRPTNTSDNTNIEKDTLHIKRRIINNTHSSFIDDFTNNKNGWKDETEEEKYGGRYLIKNNSYHLKSTKKHSNNETYILLPFLSSEIFIIKIDFSLSSAAFGKDNKGLFSFVWNKNINISNSGSSFSIIQKSYSNKIRIGNHVDNITEHNPDVFNCPYFCHGSMNLVEIEIIHSTGVFYLNGREIRRVENLKRDGDYLGFITKGRIYPMVHSIEVKF